MGSGWHEWPLMIFTVFGQCVVGALIVSGLGWLTAKDDTIARQRIVRSMFFLLASIMHLGSPMRAFNSLNRVGASALSNEIAAGSVFFAVGGIWWLVAVLGKMPPALGKVWLLVSMALGVAFIWAMTLVYQIDTVPTWYNGYTTLAFFDVCLLAAWRWWCAWRSSYYRDYPSQPFTVPCNRPAISRRITVCYRSGALSLFIWGIGLETLKARQVDLLYLGQRHLMLVFTSMFFALLVGIPSGILLSRPAAKGFAEYVMWVGDRPPLSRYFWLLFCLSSAIPMQASVPFPPH